MGNRYKKWMATYWPTRLDQSKDRQGVFIKKDGSLEVGFWKADSDEGVAVKLSRLDARLLARRINGCLKETQRR